MSNEEELKQEENVAEGINDNSDQSQIEELKDQLLRAFAEKENLRKRYEKTIEETKSYAVTSFAKDIISVMDNLSRALEHQPKEVSDDVRNVILGIELTKQELQNIFNKHKIKAISPSIGEKFDYNTHNAVSQIESDGEPGTIVNVMQNGYSIENRLLRPAMVTVVK